MDNATSAEAAFKSAIDRFGQLLRSLTSCAVSQGSPTFGAQLTAELERWLRESFSAMAGTPVFPWPWPTGTPVSPSASLHPVSSNSGAAGSAQRIMKLTEQWFQAQAQLAVFWSNMAHSATEKFIAQVGLLPPELDLHNATTLYDLLISCAEEAHAQMANCEKYVAARALLINTTAELTLEQRSYMEMCARALGLPSRSDIEAIQADLSVLKRALQANQTRSRRNKRKSGRSR
jgi:hypothetical protein